MLTISKRCQLARLVLIMCGSFASQEQNYWSRDQQGHSEWQGRLADSGVARGVVRNTLHDWSEGQTSAHRRAACPASGFETYEGKFGKEVTQREHRAGWGPTFSAPKSVSLTALVGGDDRVREAHRESVRVALQEIGVHAGADRQCPSPERPGKFIAATSSTIPRGPSGYGCTELHTPCRDLQINGA